MKARRLAPILAVIASSAAVTAILLVNAPAIAGDGDRPPGGAGGPPNGSDGSNGSNGSSGFNGSNGSGGSATGSGSACERDPSPKLKAINKDDAATIRLNEFRKAKDDAYPLESTWYETEFLTDYLYVVIGPDGHQRGVVPSSVREDAQIFVVVHRPEATEFGVSITGCERPQSRVLGSAAQFNREDTGDNVRLELEYTYDIYALGQCNADKEVEIKIDVPEINGCAAASQTVKLKTAPVYNFTVGYGAVFIGGSRDHVGLDLGAGGNPSRAFQRNEKRGLSDRILLGWFPFGYSPDTSMLQRSQGQSAGWSFLRHVMVGTTVDPERPLSSVNLLLGLEPAPGFAIFGGFEFCDKQDALGADLQDGSIYTDDSSTLPKKSKWHCDNEAFIGVSVTTDLLGKLIAR